MLIEPSSTSSWQAGTTKKALNLQLGYAPVFPDREGHQEVGQGQPSGRLVRHYLELRRYYSTKVGTFPKEYKKIFCIKLQVK